MEFVNPEDVTDLLEDYTIEQVAQANECVLLRMADGDGVVHVHMACRDTKCQPRAGAEIVPVEKDRLPNLLDHIIHLLHISQALLIPVGKWRKVFDAVAFSLARNEHWQEIDATATVELNTRDPLLCEPADMHILADLTRALINDADAPDQGLFILATASPVLVELVPDGAIRMSLGSRVLADEVAEALAG